MNVKKKLRKLERRIAALETPDLPPVNTLHTRPVDTDTMWRAHVVDYSAAWCGEDGEDYSNGRGYL